MNLSKYKIRNIKHFGQIGAGRVLPFVPRDVVIPVFLPDDGSKDDDYGTVEISGISLEDEFIFSGDLLIFTRRFKKAHVTPDAVCVLFVKSMGELMAKKVLLKDRPDTLTLRSSGGDTKDIYVEPEDVEIWGVAIGLQRMWIPGGKIPGKFDGYAF